MANDKETRTIEIVLKAQDANASLKEMAAGAAVMTAQLSKMGQDDPGRAKLLGDLQEMNQRLAAQRAEMRQVVKSEEELTAAAEALAVANQETVESGQQATASLNQMKAAASILEKQLSDLSQDDPNRAQLQQDFATLTQRIGATSAAMRVQGQSAEELAAQEAATAAAAEQLAQANEHTVATGKSVTASLGEMKAAAGLMEKQLVAMSQDDPNRAALQRDFTQLTQRIGDANTIMRTHIKTEQELAAEQAQLAAAAEKLNRENITVVVNGQKVSATFNEMKASAAVLEKQLGDLSHDAPGRAKMLQDYKGLQERIEDVKNEMGQAAPKASLFKDAMGLAGIALTAEAAIGGVIEVGKAVFEATAKFEKYEAVMTNALGDKSKAQQAMKDIQLMAAKTPFSVDELTGSFIKFVNRGLNPSMAEMTKMADLAASQGKSFDQLTEAVLDAGGGEFERLKEFGIKASKSGDEVSLSFKGVNQTVKNTPEAINGAIMAFGGMQGVAGSTAAISKTLEGQWSNLGDTADMLETKVGGGLTPVFTLIMSVFSGFLGWITRFIDAAGPLKQVFDEVGKIVGDFYHEIADVLESLGLFSEKTDTVKIAVEILKVALTVLLIPIKTLYLAAKGITDVFIDWYNKSEMLRGVLGGLGAVIVSMFMTIKDDALKILGGVSDIIVGIFTLDKNKIIAGFKSAMSATADVMLEGGQRAAEQFSKGFEANKNNKIIRKVRVETETSGDGDAQPAGEKLTSDKSSGDAAAEKKREAAEKKAKAARDKADREKLNDLKRWVKEEGDQLDIRDQLAIARQEAANTDELKRREAQRQKIMDAADKKYKALTGQEADYAAQVKALVEERDLQLRELQAGFDDQDEKDRKKKLDEKFADMAADEEIEKATLEDQRANGLITEQEYQDKLYEVTRQGLEKRLALLVEAGQGESVEAKKIQAALIKGKTDHTIKDKKLEDDKIAHELKVAGQGAALLKDGLQLIEDNLDQKTQAYQAFKAARKAAELAELGINLAAEIQQIWAYSSENPLNGVTAGAAGTVQAVIQTGLAVTRAASAGAKIAAFADGGATNRPGKVVSAESLVGLVSGASGGSFAGGGIIAGPQIGLIGEAGAELVIPNWLFTDPKQANIMGFLEAQIASRGNAFADGGRTVKTPSPMMDEDSFGGASGAVVELLEKLNANFGGFKEEISDWQRNLVIQNNLHDVRKGLAEIEQVKTGGGLRAKPKS